MTNKPDFTIIIPAYNEENSIESTIDQIYKLPGNFELIIIDDGSTDKTSSIAKKTKAKVVTHKINKGYGASLKTGIKLSLSDVIVITDADGTYPVERIPDLVEMKHKENFNMVVGARIGDDVNISLVRIPAKWFITKLASYLSRENIPDLNSGLRVMDKKVILEYLKFLPDGFSFTTTITLAMLSNNYSVKYEPINYYKREGRSKIKPIQDTLNFIFLIIKMILYFDPLRVFLPLSMALLFPGFLLIIFQALSYHNITTTSVIICLSGVQLGAIGMIADLIVKKG